jgi:hypothetical protein
MSSLLYTLEGWPSSPGSNNIARSFNNDSLVWSTAIAAPPFTGQVPSTDFGQRQNGGWDGNKWYVIGPDGKLYAYNPGGNTWSSALFGGTVIISGTVSTQKWCMASDGRFIYILDSGSGFRRYDPNADTLTGLSAIPGNSFSAKMLLVYDGDDTLYGYKGGTDNPHQIAKFTISTNTWTVLPSQATLNTDLVNNYTTWAAFLGGKFWLLYHTGTTAKAFVYDPSGNTWTAKATFGAATGNVLPAARGGEMTDSTIRLWTIDPGEATVDYNVGTDTWSRGPNSPVTFRQGGNHAITRLFQPIFTWLESDGVTPASITELLGTLTQGDTTTAHLKVKTAQAHAGGATVSVPASFTTDAEDPVTICATAGGVYSTSFTTAALNANDVFDVFVKVAPTVLQTPGLTKLFHLRPVGN